jgi:hypothetical protein
MVEPDCDDEAPVTVIVTFIGAALAGRLSAVKRMHIDTKIRFFIKLFSHKGIGFSTSFCHIFFLLWLTTCPTITMISAIKNIALPITFACAGIPRAAET